MSVSVTLDSKIKTIETSDANLVSTQDATRTYNGLDTAVTLNSTSTPDAEDAAYFRITLVAGAATLDLTAMLHQISSTATLSKSASGKKVRAWKFKAPTGNTGNIVVTKGASNGYSPVGTTFTKVIAPGGYSEDYFYTSAGDVGGSAKNLDVTGTGTEYVDVGVVWG